MRLAAGDNERPERRAVTGGAQRGGDQGRIMAAPFGA